jgi:hypothetical protein
MRRDQLEHLIRAAGTITQEGDLIIIGSQSILGAFPDAPSAALMSVEADMYPRDRPEAVDLIEGALGQLSQFDETHGYHADAVGPETAALPDGWGDRLVPIQNDNTNGVTGWCLDPTDLVASKLIAGREKDHYFAAVLLNHNMIQAELLDERIGQIPDSPLCSAAHRESAQAWLGRWQSRSLSDPEFEQSI